MTAEMLGSMILLTSVLTAVVYASLPRLRRHRKLDDKVFAFLRRHESDTNNKLMSAVTVLAGHNFLVPANLSLIAFFLYVRRRSWFFIRIAAIAMSSLLLMFLLKSIFKRKRPRDPLFHQVKGLSFPSGHSIFAVTFYGLMIYITNHSIHGRAAKIAIITGFIGLINIIGLSRVWLRVHYASDVLAGFAIGSTWLIISLATLMKLEPEASRIQWMFGGRLLGTGVAPSSL